MCSPYIRKEANRFNWMIKGKLIDRSWTDEAVEKTYDSYFTRLWNNNENYLHEDGFQQAWERRQEEMLEEEMKYVAIPGYN